MKMTTPLHDMIYAEVSHEFRKGGEIEHMIARMVDHLYPRSLEQFIREETDRRHFDELLTALGRRMKVQRRQCVIDRIKADCGVS